MYNNDFKMDGVKHTEFLTAAQQHSEFLTAQQHTLRSGMASYDGGRNFLFSPDEPVAGLLPRFRCHGIAQQMTDGTFDFVAKPKVKPQSQLIKKLAHGRVSKTKDEAIQLTLKSVLRRGRKHRRGYLQRKQPSPRTPSWTIR